MRDQLLRAIKDKRNREKLERMRENEEFGGETDEEYAERIAHLRELEENKKRRFREDLQQQAADDRERRARQKAEENYVEFIDDSELIKAQMEREAAQKVQYRNDLKMAVEAKHDREARIKAQEAQDAEFMKLLDREHRDRLTKMQEMEFRRKKQFQNDLQRQLDAKRARLASEKQEDVNWAREQDAIYQKMIAEERIRDYEFKKAFRAELDREIKAKADRKAAERLN